MKVVISQNIFNINVGRNVSTVSRFLSLVPFCFAYVMGWSEEALVTRSSRSKTLSNYVPEVQEALGRLLIDNTNYHLLVCFAYNTSTLHKCTD